VSSQSPPKVNPPSLRRLSYDYPRFSPINCLSWLRHRSCMVLEDAGKKIGGGGTQVSSLPTSTHQLPSIPLMLLVSDRVVDFSGRVVFLISSWKMLETRHEAGGTYYQVSPVPSPTHRPSDTLLRPDYFPRAQRSTIKSSNLLPSTSRPSSSLSTSRLETRRPSPQALNPVPQQLQN
jgi:hypothetical protein